MLFTELKVLFLGKEPTGSLAPGDKLAPIDRGYRGKHLGSE
jgi:hypothetical protein